MSFALNTKETPLTHSTELFKQAQHFIPGGVNSPVRAFGAVGGIPRFIHNAQGAYLTDADGIKYIDYVGSWGPAILGHAHPTVVEAVHKAVNQGLSFGAPCELEVELAKTICQLMPSIEKIRFVSSGTESVMSAIRLARAATGRNKIVKFIGCYHGHADSLLIQAGSGALTYGVPSSPGVTPGAAQDTLVANFNDLKSVHTLFDQHSSQIAAIIVEPIAANMNVVLPLPEFLSGLRQICDANKSLLIFDEVITGFRVHLGGAQALYNIRPDLTTLGKIIGGGMPVGAFGGRAELMDQMAPLGPVYQAGTLSGNPITMAAGLATLQVLQEQSTYEKLGAMTHLLMAGISQLALTYNIPLTVQSVCGIFGLFFTNETNITQYEQVMACNQDYFKQFFHALLEKGIYIAPSAFEAGFLSLAHGEEEIQKTLQQIEWVFKTR